MKTIITMVIGILFLTLPVNGQFNPPQNKDNTLLVKGIAILRQIPEIIYASINIKAESQEYIDCQDKVMTKMQKVKSVFMSHNIDKDLIKTNEVAVSEKRDVINGKMVNTGFIGNVSLIIESPYSPEVTQNLLAALKTDSLSINYSIGFKLSEAQKALLRQKAITMAIDDAKEKAILIAKSSNIKLVRINSIEYRDDDLSWSRDRDIIKEDILPSQDVFLTLRGNNSNTPNIDFNPKEIGILKTVQIEWVVSENK
jgi:uncharacterized protein